MIRPRILPVFLFSVINFLFVYKYAWRLVSYALPVALIYVFILCIAVFYVWKLPLHFFRIRFLYIYIGLFSLVYIISIQFLDVQGLRVDRWSVITSFLDNLFSGAFPYLAKSHEGNPPGPFPFYFVIAIPFYFIGEIGYLSLAGLLAFMWYTKRIYNNNQIVIVLVVLLSSSPSFLWELLTRSTLVINMVLLVFYLSYLEKVDYSNWKSMLPAGFIGGLLLSTRGIIAVALLAYTAYAWLRNHEYIIWIRMMFYIALGFLTTLVPFLIWDAELFIKYNPITLQAGFLPFWLLLLFLGLSIYIGLKVKSLSELYRILGTYFFIIIAAAWIKVIVSSGFHHTLLLNGFDISYFLFAVPFLLLGIADREEM